MPFIFKSFQQLFTDMSWEIFMFNFSLTVLSIKIIEKEREIFTIDELLSRNQFST